MEIGLFGPLTGESCAINLGDRDWLIIDAGAKLPRDRSPALEFISAHGHDPETDVRCIVATHFHSDHVALLEKTIDICQEAEIVLPDLARIHHPRIESVIGNVGTASVKSIYRIRSFCEQRKRRLTYAKDFQQIGPAKTRTGSPVRIESIAPTSAPLNEAMAALVEALQHGGDADQVDIKHSNASSVVVVVTVGDACALFGADLESAQWNDALANRKYLGSSPTLVKVPHHGGSSAHHDGMWMLLVEPNPIAIVTPNGKLPQPHDVERIANLVGEGNAYITSPPSWARPRANYGMASIVKASTSGAWVSAKWTAGEWIISKGAAATALDDLLP